MVAAGLLKPETDWKRAFTTSSSSPQDLHVTCDGNRAARARRHRWRQVTRAHDSGPVVEVLSAEKIFANGTRALDPIDLTIADGEFLR